MKHRETFQLFNADCLQAMQALPDQSVDMVLCDLPYGVTACKWDSVIPMDQLWQQYKRIVKRRGVIALTATQPFASLLVTSNLPMFRHEWVWDKVRPSGFQNAKHRPMNRHEHVLIFARQSRYLPVMELRDKPVRGRQNRDSESNPIGTDGETRTYTHRYPQSIVKFCRPAQNVHPTQKSVELFEYIIRNYTLPGETVLDNCMGSGTTGVACANTGRHFIGMEMDENYFQIASERINESQLQTA